MRFLWTCWLDDCFLNLIGFWISIIVSPNNQFEMSYQIDLIFIKVGETRIRISLITLIVRFWFKFDESSHPGTKQIS